MAQIGALDIDLRLMTQKFEKGLAGANKSLDKMSNSFSNIGGNIVKMLAFTGVTVALGDTVAEAEKLQRNMLRTEQLVKSTGAAAGKTAKQLHEEARQLALATLESTEGVMEAQQVMLTFKSVTGDTFSRSIGLASDLATVTGGNLKSSVTQLGKALEDPVKGINAMTRSGVSFTEEQKAMIKSLVAAGDKAAAQKLILDELSSQYGGVAKNEAKGFAGAQDTLGQAFQEAQQAVGKFIVEGEGSVSVINFMSDALFKVPALIDSVVNSWVTFTDNLKFSDEGFYVMLRGIASAITSIGNAIGPALPYIAEVMAVLGGSAVGVAALAGSVGLVGKAFVTMGSLILANPIGATIAAIAAAAYLIYDNWEDISAFFEKHWKIVTQTFDDAMTAISDFVDNGLSVVKGLFPVAFGAISVAVEAGLKVITGDFSGAWLVIKEGVSGFISGFSNMFSGLMSGVSDLVGSGLAVIKNIFPVHFAAISTIVSASMKALSGNFSGAWLEIKNGLSDFIAQFLDVFTGLDVKLFDIGANIIGGLVKGIKNTASSAVDAVSNLAGDIASSITGYFDIRSPSRLMMGFGENIIMGLINGIKSLAGSAVSTVTDLASSIGGAITGFFDINSPSRLTYGYGQNIAQGLSDGIAANQVVVSEAALGVSNAANDSFSQIGDGLVDAETKMTEFSATAISWQEDFTSSLLEGEEGIKSFFTTLVSEYAKAQLQQSLFGSDGSGGLLGSLLGSLGGSGSGGFLSTLFGGLAGFATGGSFGVGGSGGTDSQLVAFKATPNERVTVETPQQQRASSDSTGSVSVPVYVNIQNAPEGSTVNDTTDADGARVIDIMLGQVQNGGKVMQAMEFKYPSMKRAGV